MSTQVCRTAGKICLSAVLLGSLVASAGCAKNKTSQTAPPPAALTSGPSLVTGSISAPAQTSATRSNPGTVTGVKTAALGTATTAVATRTTKNKISLAFPKKGYALSGDQSAQIASFVKDAKRSKKRIKVIGIATAKKGAKDKGAMEKARLEAKRRAKATSMFLRVYGIETDDMTITTADARPQKGVSPRRVEVAFQ